MAGLVWVSDREPGIRQLFAELMPEAEVLEPDELTSRLRLGQLPDALVIDGTQLLDLPQRIQRRALDLPRILICTGLSLGGLNPSLVSAPGVAILAKPFCVDDLEAAIEWLRGTPVKVDPELLAPVVGPQH
jgi:hypothetical protein